MADAHTTDDPSQFGVALSAEQVIAHTNLSWSWVSSPGRQGATVATAEVDFSAGS